MVNKTAAVLSQTLGLPIPQTPSAPQMPTRPSEPPDDPIVVVKQDFNLARKNITDLVEKGAEALGHLIELAKAGEHPRAYEAIAAMIKVLSDANKDLMHVHSQRKDVTPSDQNPVGGINAVFVGSTSDLQELIRKNVRPKIIDVSAEPTQEATSEQK